MEIKQRHSDHETTLDDSIHPVLKSIYAARGVVTPEQLRLDLADLLPPDALKHSHEAAVLLANAMEKGCKILVVGDFDADGATSCALFLLVLKAMGYTQADFLVPNRFEYGYGLTPEIVAVAQQSSPDLIVTVDNGIASHSGVIQARKAGIDVLVTDHHLPAETLPDASCIVNPNQPGCDFPSKSLAGVGVVFYVMCALRKELRQRDWFGSRHIQEPNMAIFLDLVALGTVADVVPLDQNNRRLVKYGLGIIRSGKGRPGIRMLLDVAGRDPSRVVASDLGFAAGPRLNAAGRLDDMSFGIHCLMEDNTSKARDMALVLDGMNRDRRQIEQDMQAQALEALSHLDVVDPDQLGICLYDPGWHQGVIGILASRIKERYHRPCIVFADAGMDAGGNPLIKGSARSVEGLHIRDALDLLATTHPDILSHFGGHAMAAGMSIHRAHFEAFSVAFEQVLQQVVDSDDLKQVCLVDGELGNDCLTLEFAAVLRESGPWGQHFPEPVFLGEFSVISSRVVGAKHLKLTLQLPGSDELIDGIAFNVEEQIREAELSRLSLVYRLDVNEFRGHVNPQLMVEHIVDYKAH